MIRPAAAPWLAALLLAAHAGLGLWSASTHSPTFDEPALVAGGLGGWTGDFRMAPNDPPLALLWISSPARGRAAWGEDWPEWRGGYAYAFAERLLFWSGNDGVALIERGRRLNLLLSLLLGALLFRFLAARYRPETALAGLALYAFSPSVLAHASLATTDFPAAFFVGLSAMALMRFREKPTAGRALAFAAAGLAAPLCKYSAVLVWPAAFLTLARDRRALKAWTLWALLPAAAIGGALALTTGVGAGFAGRAGQALSGVHPTFALGLRSETGWRWYYLLALAAKSSLPELLVIAMTPPHWISALYFAAASLSHKQIGLRYVLPLYVLLPLAAAPLFERLRKLPRGPLLVALLAGWQAAAALGAAPHHLAYFNEFAPDGHKILSDSNVDWGQDLGRLGDWLRENPGEVILSYFGTASPEPHGFKPQHLLSHAAVKRRMANSRRPEREWLAVSATNLHGVYLKDDPFAWLRERRPYARIGRGLFVYDVTKDADAHVRLARIYAAAGDAALAAREARRAADIMSR